MFRAGKVVVDTLPLGKGLLHRRGAFMLHAPGRSKVERPDHGVDDVTSHVAERARPKIIPAAPCEGMIDLLLEKGAPGPRRAKDPNGGLPESLPEPLGRR